MILMYVAFWPSPLLGLCFRQLQTDAVLTTEASQHKTSAVPPPIYQIQFHRWRLNPGSDRRDHEGVRADRTTKERQQMPGP